MNSTPDTDSVSTEPPIARSEVARLFASVEAYGVRSQDGHCPNPTVAPSGSTIGSGRKELAVARPGQTLTQDHTLASDQPLASDRTLASDQPLASDRTLASDQPLASDRTLASDQAFASNQTRAPGGQAMAPVAQTGTSVRKTVLGGLLAASLAGLGWFPIAWEDEVSWTGGEEPVMHSPTERLSDLPRSPDVAQWVQALSTEHRVFIQEDLTRGGPYRPLISDALDDRGLPPDLAVLPLIESQFLTRARSQAEAVGLWQFVPETARGYGLRIDEWVDERRDPVASTESAVDYLVRLRERFGDWRLILAAYNAGPTRIAREIARSGGDASFEDIAARLPRETRAYVPKAIAAAIVSGEADLYGFDVVTEHRYSFDEVWVPGGTSLGTVAGAVGEPLSALRWLNPHLIQGVTPPGPWYPVRVPEGLGEVLIASYGGERSASRRYADD